MNEFNARDDLRSTGLRSLSLRAKITLGILVTGGIAVGMLSLFAYSSGRQIINLLSGRLEQSVNQQTEELLNSTLAAQAQYINNIFQDAIDDVAGMANYRASLEAYSASLGQGVYWDAHTKLIRLPGGQYGNPSSDTASVFIPSHIPIDETVLSRLNITSYLDFYAPGILKAHKEIVAVYFIDANGVTTYYPNIDLANKTPPDFDVTSQIFFKIATPLYDPQRLPRLTPPYQDPAGTGLIVTIAAPVYIGDQFQGVAAADLQLERITSRVEEISVGQSGYAFLVDKTGHIIAMPPAGYALFGLQPEKVEVNESPKQTITGKGAEELQSAVRRMVAGGTGLLTVPLKEGDVYIAYTYVPAANYGLALIVPVSEMNTALVSARQDTERVVSSTFRLGALTLIGLLAAASLASIYLSRIISKPVVRLTQTVEQITAGDLSARASIETGDEIGRLAVAFNSMTARLRDSLASLEQQVTERTAALQRRSTELETVAELARDIASYHDLDTLLSVTVDLIRERFNFYHAGIFLVDDRGEYAILRAATGLAGQKMLENHHKLKVGETGIVGYVTSTGQPRISLDTGLDAVYFDNPLLPETKSEIALPLRSRNRIIGALDIQSREPNAFKQENVRVFQLLADQLVAAIENAQLVEQVESTLQQLNAAYRTQTQQAWQRAVQARGAVAYEYDGLQIKPVPHQIPGQDLKRLQNGQPIVTKTEHIDHDHGLEYEHGSTLLVPLMLSNQVIGVIGVENEDPDFVWTEEEIAIARAAAERAAIALENARLLEESQRRAVKERTIGEISAKLGNVLSIDGIIETAARELSRSLSGAKVAIQIQNTMDTN